MSIFLIFTNSANEKFISKETGADIVKQWDSTLDRRTRKSHQRVDGEIRELDEKFSNGLMYPGDPSGKAAEVINCRCVALQRAKWALDEDELETLKERASYYGLDKTKNFDEYKEKYLIASSTINNYGLGTNNSDFAKNPQHDAPTLLKTIDYSDKNAVKSTLKKYEKEIVNSEVENAIVVTKEGSVYKCVGSLNGVNLTDELGDLLYGSSMTHNHPIGSLNEYSFSGEDWGIFDEYEIETMRGVDEIYEYELTRLNDVVDERIINDTYDADYDFVHTWNIEKANEKGLGYGRKNADDEIAKVLKEAIKKADDRYRELIKKAKSIRIMIRISKTKRKKK